MRSDHVYALDGDVLTVSDAKSSSPAFQVAIRDASRAVVRVVVDEALSDAEAAECLATFEADLALPNGRLVLSSRYSSGVEDEDDEEADRVEVKLPKGAYRMAVHATLAGPLAPAKLEKEALRTYFGRTRPGDTLPSWLHDDDSESEDFWVGLILHLEPAGKAGKTAKPVPGLAGKPSFRKPAVCPPGLLSIRPDGWDRYVQTDLRYIHDIPRMVAKLTPTPLEGGVVPIPIRELILPYWLAWICGETHPGVRIRCAPEYHPDWPGFKQGIKATRLDDGWRIDIEGSNARWTQFGHLRQVAALLEGLTDGSAIELSCASEDGEGKKGRQRYLGSVANGEWRIDSTYPTMAADSLRDMLDLVRQAEGGTVVRARDAAEADRLEAAIHKKDFLLREKPPVRDGLTFRLPAKNRELMPFLIARAFLARYPKALPAIDRDDDLGGWDGLMDTIAEAGARFATGEVVLQGQFATFTRADLDGIEAADHAFARACDEELLGMGFQLLGDLHSTQTFQAVFRGYGLPGEPVYAAIIENGFGSAQHDFYTRFPDGHSLTTSTGDGAKARFQTDRKAKAYRLEVPGAMADRWTAHRGKLAELSERHGPPGPAGDLAGFAAELDDFLCRQHGRPKA